MPVTRPALVRLRPAGRVPDETAKLTLVPFATVSCCEYESPTLAFVSQELTNESAGGAGLGAGAGAGGAGVGAVGGGPGCGSGAPPMHTWLVTASTPKLFWWPHSQRS